MTRSLVCRPHDGRICGARTRAGTPCRYPRGYKTDHFGQGRCRLHGGATPIRHGLHSTIIRPSIQERLLRLAPPQQQLLIELASLRAAILDPTTRVDALYGAQRVVPLIDATVRALIRGR
jgi:hypothetical protein